MSSNGAASGSSRASEVFQMRPVITSAEWDARVKRGDVSKEFLNKLVMNYLVTEGYRDAAAHFVDESGTQPEADLTTMDDRVAMRKAIMDGDVTKAINLAIDMDPMMLDRNRDLRFSLLKQRLLELVRQGDTDAALDFATERLAPEGGRDPALLREVEEAVTLLAFEDLDNCPLSGLLNVEQRQRAAGRLNAAVLENQQQDSGPWLTDHMRQLVYHQNALAERVEFPRIIGVGSTKSDREEDAR